ncbi:MAG: gliding motility-associated ABC transporter permease subunit GldF [Bacteroidia bacterium]|nr:gliding motility-associated ABC transporter permease subunit GldF [Bacteroidia bacterium]
MFTLFKKELSGFFSSLIGYIVITVYLVANSLFIWVFPGTLNIPDAGYSSLEPMFTIAPWIFLFLVPAITMRLFADEKKSGTIELLLTRPIGELQIVIAKYLAGLTLVLFSLIPSLVFFLSVYLLGSPVGNIDTGGTWGSYIGLFFLAAVYVSIGVFSSSITENQIISFILSVLISFLFFTGFDAFASLVSSGKLNLILTGLGINYHYMSMSKGVIDTRDVIYFLSMITIFIIFTRIVLESRKWK